METLRRKTINFDHADTASSSRRAASPTRWSRHTDRTAPATESRQRAPLTPRSASAILSRRDA